MKKQNKTRASNCGSTVFGFMQTSASSKKKLPLEKKKDKRLKITTFRTNIPPPPF